METELLTTKDVAARLGVTVNRVQAMIRAERLPAQRLGRDFVIKESDLALVSERKAGRPKKEGAAVVAPAVTSEPTKPRSAKSLTEAEKKRIRDAQQRRWAGAKSAQKNSKK